MSGREAVTRPAPVLTEDNHWFWDAARDGKIVAQKCSGCHRFRHPPRPMCPWCHSLQFEITELSGQGEVYSYSALHHPQNPAFEYPVIAALIDLEEGVRVLSNLVDVEPGDVRIGMVVVVDFRPTLHDAQVPVFRPRSETR
ncbi:MAG TPA: Zn-ribbon domain-containing OB-fold protein [Acidimicrobiales bacterium]